MRFILHRLFVTVLPGTEPRRKPRAICISKGVGGVWGEIQLTRRPFFTNNKLC